MTARVPSSTTAPPLKLRIAVALVAALATAAFVWWFGYRAGQFGPGGSDFDHLWFAARTLITTGDPYARLSSGPLLYPLPTVLVATPFALLPRLVARIGFVSLSAGLFTFALTRDGFQRLPIILSAAMVDAARTGQWSMLFAAAVMLPALNGLAVVKPNLGAALCAATASRRALLSAAVGAAALVGAAFAVDAGWIRHWLTSLASRPDHFRIPLLGPGGPLLALAVLRWRRLDARLLLAWAAVPHAPLLYDVLPLAIVARTRQESLVFALLTYAALFAQSMLIEQRTDGTATLAVGILNLTIYLPCLIVVLRRPNEGEPPAWLTLLHARRAASR